VCEGLRERVCMRERVRDGEGERVSECMRGFSVFERECVRESERY